MGTTQESYLLFWTKPESSTPENSGCTATYHLSLNPFKLDKQDILGTARGKRTHSWETFSYGVLDMDMPVLAKQEGLTYISTVLKLDAVKMTSLEQWMIVVDDEDDIHVCVCIYIYTERERERKMNNFN